MKVNLLNFFKNGDFGGVRIGFYRNEVEKLLGKPDVAVWGPYKSSDNYNEAGLWYYAGVQLVFGVEEEENILYDIGFRLGYLHPDCPYRDLSNESTVFDYWVLDPQRPLNIDDLIFALKNESIPFVDTGLESCIFDETIKMFRTIPYQPGIKDDEPFGTIVLKSGVQIRYLDDRSIVRVAVSKDAWMIKGREQTVTWLEDNGTSYTQPIAQED